MFTDRYCPKCALRLREVRREHGQVQCRNGHRWTWEVQHGERLISGDDPEVI